MNHLGTYPLDDHDHPLADGITSETLPILSTQNDEIRGAWQVSFVDRQQRHDRRGFAARLGSPTPMSVANALPS